MKPINIIFRDFEDFENKTGLLHGRRISRGLQIQKAIYTNIKNSNKHLEFHYEYEINLPIGGQKKSHKIDIVIVDTDSVRAFDSKSKSFNATQDAQGVLEEYQKLSNKTVHNHYYRTYQTKDGIIAVACLSETLRKKFADVHKVHDIRFEENYDPYSDETYEFNEKLVPLFESLMKKKEC